MVRVWRVVIIAVVAGVTVTGQTSDERELAAAVRERFEVAYLTDGLALTPRDPAVGVRLVELRDRRIGIDGMVVTGQELYERLGEEADLLVRLSYLDPATRLALFGRVSDRVSPNAPREEPAAEPPPRRGRSAQETTTGDVVRIGGAVTVEPDERVRGDVVVIGGSLTADGEVTGDVVVIGGRARFGPRADIHGEVTVIGGGVDRAPTARLRQGVNHVWLGNIDFDVAEWLRRDRVSALRRTMGGTNLWGTVLRLLFLALMASLVAFVARGSVERAAERSGREPVKAGVVGFLAQLLLGPLFVVSILLLVVSIIGIPLLVLMPFLVVAVLVVMLVGFAGTANALGRWARARFGLESRSVHLSIWVGIAVILIPTLIGEAFDVVGGPFRILAVLLALTGALAEYVAWTTGFGAIILNRFDPVEPSRGLPPLPSPSAGTSPDGSAAPGTAAG